MAHHPSGPAARTPGESVEDVQIAGHIIDSLILPKILDLITAGGGSFRIKEFTIGQARSDPSFALVEVRAPARRLAGRDFGSDRRARSGSRVAARLPTGRRRHRRRISRRVLQHDESTDRSSPRRPLDRSPETGNGLRDRRRPVGAQGALRADERGELGTLVRRWPRRRARFSARAVGRAADVRVHEQPGLDRKAQGRGHPANCPGAAAQPELGGQDAAGRRPGDRSHRQRAARVVS